MNQETLHRYVLENKGNEKNICQIHVIKDGKPIYDDTWHGFQTEDAMHVMSVTKGVMSLLIGIAVTQNKIEGVSQKVLEFFPDYQVKRGEKTIYDVTLRHLLTMTAPYKYKSEPWTKVCNSSDWTIAVLDLLGGRGGITGEFKYATLGIQLLTGILEQFTGMKCLDFANKYLFGPLAIPEIRLHGDSSKEDQFDYVMNKAPRKHEWYSDPQGAVTAGWGICLSACDMAKLGQVVLNDGTYGKTQILSEKWVKEMTSNHLTLGERFGYMQYGYLWYRPLKDDNVFAAIGDNGNIIYVNREKNLTVGITGTFQPRIYDRVAFIESKLLPAVLQ